MSDFTSKVSLDSTDYVSSVDKIHSALNRLTETGKKVASVHKSMTEDTLKFERSYRDLTEAFKAGEKGAAKFSYRTEQMEVNLNKVKRSIGSARNELDRMFERSKHMQSVKLIELDSEQLRNLRNVGYTYQEIEAAVNKTNTAISKTRDLYKSPEFQQRLDIDRSFKSAKDHAQGLATQLKATTDTFKQFKHEGLEPVKAQAKAAQDRLHALLKLAEQPNSVAGLKSIRRQIEGAIDDLARMNAQFDQVANGAKWQDAVANVAGKRVHTTTDPARERAVQEQMIREALRQAYARTGTNADTVDKRLDSKDPAKAAAARAQYAEVFQLREQLNSHIQETTRLLDQESAAIEQQHHAEILKTRAVDEENRKRQQDAQTKARYDRLQDSALVNIGPAGLESTQFTEETAKQNALALAMAKTKLQGEELTDVIWKIREGNRATINEYEELAGAIREYDMFNERIYKDREKQATAAKLQAAKDKEAAEAEARLAHIRDRSNKLRSSKALNDLIPENISMGAKIMGIGALDELREAAARTNIPLDKLADTLARIKAGDSAVIKENYELAESYRRLQTAVHNTDRAVQTFKLDMGSIGRLAFARLMTHAFYGMTTQIWAAWDATKELSRSIAQIETLSQRLPLSTREWGAGIAEISKQYGLAQTDVAKSVYETLSNQVAEGQGALDFQDTIAKFSITTGASMEDGLNLISAAMNAFNMETSQATEIAAKFFKIQDLGRVTTTDMANTFGRVAAQANIAGLTLDEVGGLISHLTIQGIKFGPVSTLITNIVNKLSKPTPAFKGFLQQAFGTGSTEAVLKQHGLMGIFEAMKEANLTSLEELGPQMRDIRAMTAVKASTEDLKGLDDTIAEIRDNSLPDYLKANEIAFQSSAQIVAEQTERMKANFLDLTKGVLNFIAATADITKKSGLGELGDLITLGGGGLAGMAALGGSSRLLVDLAAGMKGPDIRATLRGGATAREQGGQKGFQTALLKLAGGSVKERGTSLALLAAIEIVPVLLSSAAAGAFLGRAFDMLLQRWRTRSAEFDTDRVDSKRSRQVSIDLTVAQRKKTEATTEERKKLDIEQQKALEALNQEHTEYLDILDKQVVAMKKANDIHREMLETLTKFVQENQRTGREQYFETIDDPLLRFQARGGDLMQRFFESRDVQAQDPELAAELLAEVLKDSQQLQKDAFSEFQKGRQASMSGDGKLIDDQYDPTEYALIFQQVAQDATSLRDYLGAQAANAAGFESRGEGATQDVIDLRSTLDENQLQWEAFDKQWDVIRKMLEDNEATLKQLDDFYKTLPQNMQDSLAPLIAELRPAIDTVLSQTEAITTGKKIADDIAKAGEQEASQPAFMKRLHELTDFSAGNPNNPVRKAIEASQLSGDEEIRRLNNADVDRLTRMRKSAVSQGGDFTGEQQQEIMAIFNNIMRRGQESQALQQKHVDILNKDAEAILSLPERARQASIEFDNWLLGRDKSQTSDFSKMGGSVAAGASWLVAAPAWLANRTMGGLYGSKAGLESGYWNPREQTTLDKSQSELQEVMQFMLSGARGDFAGSSLLPDERQKSLSAFLETQTTDITAGNVNINGPIAGQEPPQGFATGGPIFGMGGIDKVPAYLTAGEYVVRKAQAERYRGLLDAINSGEEIDWSRYAAPKDTSRKTRNYYHRKTYNNSEYDTWYRRTQGNHEGRPTGNSPEFDAWRLKKAKMMRMTGGNSLEFDTWRANPHATRHYSSGGSVGTTNNNNVNFKATINLSSTGSEQLDARKIVTAINREVHRGGALVKGRA